MFDRNSSHFVPRAIAVFGVGNGLAGVALASLARAHRMSKTAHAATAGESECAMEPARQARHLAFHAWRTEPSRIAGSQAGTPATCGSSSAGDFGDVMTRRKVANNPLLYLPLASSDSSVIRDCDERLVARNRAMFRRSMRDSQHAWRQRQSPRKPCIRLTRKCAHGKPSVGSWCLMVWVARIKTCRLLWSCPIPAAETKAAPCVGSGYFARKTSRHHGPGWRAPILHLKPASQYRHSPFTRNYRSRSTLESHAFGNARWR